MDCIGCAGSHDGRAKYRPRIGRENNFYLSFGSFCRDGFPDTSIGEPGYFKAESQILGLLLGKPEGCHFRLAVHRAWYQVRVYPLFLGFGATWLRYELYVPPLFPPTLMPHGRVGAEP